MITCGRRLRRVVGVLVLSIAVLAPSAAQAGPATPEMLAQRGFGDTQNSYAWAMEWFRGKLYVGTGRSVMCVEAAVSQFYFKFTSFYQTNPAPNVFCPPNKYDLDLRAEIWQYTPRTGNWRMVYRSPADIPNPRARGKFLARDIAYRGMKVVRDRHGREALFISGVTANEYVPEVARRHPPRLLRTYDGERFHDISVPLIVRRTGRFPDRRPIGYRGLEVWQEPALRRGVDGPDRRRRRLPGPTTHSAARPGSRRSRRPTCTSSRCRKFDGHLYVGTGSFESGYGVYRTRQTRAPFRFKPVVTDGAGMGPTMVSVVSMHPFGGRLYVGGVSWYSGTIEAAGVRAHPHRTPRPVGGGHRRSAAGTRRADALPDQRPGGGLRATSFNSHLWRMVGKDGTIYVGTLDWSWLLQENARTGPESGRRWSTECSRPSTASTSGRAAMASTGSR